MSANLTNFLHAGHAYRNSELWRTIEGQPVFAGLVAQGFDVPEEPSR